MAVPRFGDGLDNGLSTGTRNLDGGFMLHEHAVAVVCQVAEDQQVQLHIIVGHHTRSPYLQ